MADKAELGWRRRLRRVKKDKALVTPIDEAAFQERGASPIDCNVDSVFVLHDHTPAIRRMLYDFEKVSKASQLPQEAKLDGQVHLTSRQFRVVGQLLDLG